MSCHAWLASPPQRNRGTLPGRARWRTALWGVPSISSPRKMPEQGNCFLTGPAQLIRIRVTMSLPISFVHDKNIQTTKSPNKLIVFAWLLTNRILFVSQKVLRRQIAPMQWRLPDILKGESLLELRCYNQVDFGFMNPSHQDLHKLLTRNCHLKRP